MAEVERLYLEWSTSSNRGKEVADNLEGITDFETLDAYADKETTEILLISLISKPNNNGHSETWMTRLIITHVCQVSGLTVTP